MSNIEDKRKSPRVDCSVPVDGRQGAVFSNTATVDISRDGIGFISNHAVPLNERIAIELALKPDTDPVLVIGQVKWVTKVADSNKFRIGLTFSDIIDGSKEALNKSLPKRMASNDRVKKGSYEHA